MSENNNFPDGFDIEGNLLELQKKPDDMGNGNNVNNNRSGFAGNAFEWLDSIVVSLIVVVLLFTFFLGKVRVDGPSMENTLINNDQLIITYFNYTPSKGDIVIVSRNTTNDIKLINDETIKPIVKRIVAVAGQTVEVKDGFVYIDGIKTVEEYTKDHTTDDKGFIGEHTVPDGCVFVMGDNRLDSHDSRATDIGMVDTRYILGKVVARIYPFDKVRLF